MLIVLGILFAVAPAVVWTTIARTRPVGFAIGGTLLAGASLLFRVGRRWSHDPRREAVRGCPALALVLIACGEGLGGGDEHSSPAERIPRLDGAIGFLGM